MFNTFRCQHAATGAFSRLLPAWIKPGCWVSGRRPSLLSCRAQAKSVRFTAPRSRCTSSAALSLLACASADSHCKYSGLRFPRRGGLSVTTRAPASVSRAEISRSTRRSLSASQSGVSKTSSARSFSSSDTRPVIWLAAWWICSGCHWLSGICVCRETITRSDGSGGASDSSQSPRFSSAFSASPAILRAIRCPAWA